MLRAEIHGSASATVKLVCQRCLDAADVPLKVQIALGFVLDQPWIDHVVVGVDSADQLSQLVYIESNRAAAAHSGFAVDDLSLIDPSKWKLS